MDKDHSHSWVRISHGLNKLVTDLSSKEYNDNEQETSEMQFENYALKSNVLAFASRSKAKAKPQRPISASSSTKTVPIGERTWTDIEPQDYSSTDYPVSKQLITLLRHGHLPPEEDGAIEFWRLKDCLRNELEGTYSHIAYPVSKRLSTLLRHGSLPREDDGAIEFWRLKDHLRNHSVHSQHWSDEKWKSTMAKCGGNEKRFQYCTDPSRQEILYLRAIVAGALACTGVMIG